MFFAFCLLLFVFLIIPELFFTISLWSVVLICPQYWASSSGESNSMYRLGYSGTFACHNCKQKGDKWFMQKHLCKKSEWQVKFIATFNYDHIEGNFAKLHPEYASSPSVFHIIFPFFLTFYLEIILCSYWEEAVIHEYSGVHFSILFIAYFPFLLQTPIVYRKKAVNVISALSYQY